MTPTMDDQAVAFALLFIYFIPVALFIGGVSELARYYHSRVAWKEAQKAAHIHQIQSELDQIHQTQKENHS